MRQIILDYHISIEAISLEMDRCTKEEFEQNKAEIQSGPVKTGEDEIGLIVGQLGDLKQTIAMLKRNLKTKVIWVTTTGDEKGEYISVKCADTPANREPLKRRHPDIAYFVADVLGTLA